VINQQEHLPYSISFNQSIRSPLTRNVECFAFPISRQHAESVELERGLGLEEEVDPSHNGGITLARPDGRDGLFQCEKAGGAGRVHGEARPLKVKRVGDAIGKHGPTAPGQAVPVDGIWITGPGLIGLGSGGSNEDTWRKKIRDESTARLITS